ncbi:unnamed protein product [Spirodela intermedia]|uniref:Uncharacterized protein n=1 Tax=Spirodela intermedia TaxID=51605 RepID=A0A7I8IWI1_SPIIN|nr:unnamed protein product [Spirodela intermedia]CAA6662170.1 unnamed protein product [Spirodela intermedia]
MFCYLLLLHSNDCIISTHRLSTGEELFQLGKSKHQKI